MENVGIAIVVIIGIWIYGKMGESRRSNNSTYYDDINKRKKKKY